MRKTTSNFASLLSAVSFLFPLLLTAASLLLFVIPASSSETDDQLESSIKNSYVFKTYANGNDIAVQSKDGIVLLTGTVANESHKLLAGETVASQPGVKSFENKLKVQGEMPAVNSDAWLVHQVKTTLWFHKNVNATDTEVSAKDGIVTLRGDASSMAQKDLTTEYAQDVEGVKLVKNEMAIVSSTAIEPGKNIDQQMETTTATIDDASITALVKTALRHHRSTYDMPTTVETKDGVVRLEGKARNAAEKALAGKLVNDIHGVKMVVNNMSVN